MTRHIGVIANPGGVRWEGFAAAARGAGLRCTCIPWSDVLSSGGIDPPVLSGLDLVRIDSPAGDDAVEAALRGEPRQRGEVLGAASWSRGLSRAIGRLAGPERCTPHPHDMAVLMDKAACHGGLRRSGVRVPPALPPVSSWAELRQAMGDAGWSRVFVKPRYGSSGAGVVALAVGGGRVRATANLEIEVLPGGVRLYGRTRPAVLDGEAAVGAVVDALAPGGLHVERWAPKVVTGQGALDLRVVCVDGRASHAVARVARGPMTNLQAGGQRIPLAEARAVLAVGFDEAVAAAEQVAGLFPRSLQLGVDVGVLADRRSAVVFEANAFGDLLLDQHDLHGRRRTTWDVQAAALVEGWQPAEAQPAA